MLPGSQGRVLSGGVAKQADATVLRSVGEIRPGSSPGSPTKDKTVQ